MLIAIVPYPGLTALNALGPYNTLKRMKNADVRRTGPIAHFLIPGFSRALELDAGKLLENQTAASRSTRHRTSPCDSRIER